MKRMVCLLVVLTMMTGMIPTGWAETATPTDQSAVQTETAVVSQPPTEAAVTADSTATPAAEPSDAPEATTATPGEQASPADTDAPAEDTATDAPEATTAAPGEQAPPADTDAPAEDTATDAPEAVPEAGETQAPALTPGYARLSAGTKLYASSSLQKAEAELAEAGVVYAFALDADNTDAAAVWYATNGQADSAYVRADRLRMLDTARRSVIWPRRKWRMRRCRT